MLWADCGHPGREILQVESVISTLLCGQGREKMLYVEEINLSPQPIGDMPRAAKNLLDRMVNAAKPLGS